MSELVIALSKRARKRIVDGGLELDRALDQVLDQAMESELAGMIGSRLPSAMPNSNEGVKTGMFKLEILKAWVFAGT